MAWKWICISLESWMVSWYKKKKDEPVSRIACVSVKFFLVLNVHIPVYLGSRGKPFFGTLSFFIVSADCRLIRICMY
jgi:hypothetical protein